jgi:hypothetical protein
MGVRAQCRVPSCAAEAYGGWRHPFCTFHWMQIPEDLRERFQWACDEGERTGYDAAVHAILQDMGETT